MNKSNGNMYSFCTHTWNPLNGECPHRCSYCYAKHTPAGRQGYYSGPLRLNTRAMTEPLGKGRTIFVCSLNDLFAQDVPDAMIVAVLNRTSYAPDNTYLFQTKNPARYHRFLELLPPKCIVGCTIESTMIPPDIHAAPDAWKRYIAMRDLKDVRKFVTIEPIMDFPSSAIFVEWLVAIALEWVAIGADSKGSSLPEPVGWKTKNLIGRIEAAGIEVRQKANLARLLK